MKKRIILIPLALITSAISVVCINGKEYQLKGNDNSSKYNLFLSSNTETFYNENYLSKYVLTNNNNTVFINSNNANIKENGNFATLLAGSSFISVGRSDYGFNNDSEFGITKLEIQLDSNINDISIIKIVANGNKTIEYSYDSGNNKISVNLSEPVHYFAIEKEDSTQVVIKNISIDYSCVNGSPLQDLTKTYDTNYYDNYYSNILTWNNGEDLKNKLYDILHTDFEAQKYDWTVNSEADKSLYDFEMIDGVYSDKNFPVGLKNSSWNREHAFPATLLTGYATSAATSYPGRATDYHNLYASYSNGNSSRKNKNLGVADTENSYYKAAGTDTLGIGTYSYDPQNFEPADNDKGKLARSILYMGIMYKEDEPNQRVTIGTTTSVTLKGIKLKEEYVGYNVITFDNFKSNIELTTKYGGNTAECYSQYIYENAPYAIGNLSTLINWSNTNNIDRNEYQHNLVVYNTQHNRNPFIDYPELADYIYGNKKFESGRLDQLKPSYLDLNINGEKAYYAIENAKRSYNRDETIYKKDFNIVMVNNDFSTSDCDFSVQFNNVQLNRELVGTYTVNITTPINALSYDVDVLDATACNYEYTLTGVTGDLKDIKKSTVGGTVTFGNLSWNLLWGNNAKIGNISRQYGIPFGTGAVRATDLTFETEDTLEEVKLVYFNVSCAASSTGSYKMYVGEQLIKSGDYTRDASGPTLLSVTLDNPLNGKVKIVLNTTGGAIYMHSIGINYK